MKRLYISADIEGVAGITSMEQLAPEGFEYNAAREWMTNEVLAVCEAAFDAGIDEIVVSDSHGNGQNIFPERIPKNVRLIRSWPRPLAMMQGVEDGAYVGAVLLGYHTGVNNPKGGLAHTFSLSFQDVCLNGESASETVVSAATASLYGVPIIMVSGDDCYTEYAGEILPWAERVTTKENVGILSTITKGPQHILDDLRVGIKSALARRDEMRLFQLATPIDVELEFRRVYPAEILSFLRPYTRCGASRIRAGADDVQEAIDLIRFATFAGRPRPEMNW